jgi:hypothetical protein
MTTNKQISGTCFQCGKDLIILEVISEKINNSMVTTTLCECSDPACKKKTQEYLNKEKARRDEALKNKTQHYTRGSGNKDDMD